MTSSLIGADKGTHGKIVGTALAAVLLFVIVGFWAELSEDASSGSGAVVKASTPTTYTRHDGVVVR
jgi:hypothetical protein